MDTSTSTLGEFVIVSWPAELITRIASCCCDAVISAISSTVFTMVSKSSSFRFSLFVMESKWVRAYWESSSTNWVYSTHANFTSLLVLVVFEQSHANTCAVTPAGFNPGAHSAH